MTLSSPAKRREVPSTQCEAEGDFGGTLLLYRCATRVCGVKVHHWMGPTSTWTKRG